MQMNILFVIFFCIAAVQAQELQDFDILKVGDTCPITSLTTIENKTLDLSGKFVWINFFATWCPPCRAEMPELKKVWEKHQVNPKLIIVAISREEALEKLPPFVEKLELKFPVVADTDRSLYKQFAKNYIPRNYLVNPEGKIVYQSVGYEKEEFLQMVEIFEKELAKWAEQKE